MPEDFVYVIRDRVSGQYMKGNYTYSPGWTDNPAKAKRWPNASHAKARVTRTRRIGEGRSYAERWAAWLPHMEIVKIMRTYFEHSVVPH